MQNLNPPKKICAIHDISCIGRCALTVIIPTLSVLGHQVCPLPTALLSTHTGGYNGYTFHDLTDEMKSIFNHWKELDFAFDALYSGFLGSLEQIDSVCEISSYYKKKYGSLYLADPVMGDDGEVYKTYTKEMCSDTKILIKDADIITPNFTEACILLDIDYHKEYSDKEIFDMLDTLSNGNDKNIVITGIHRKKNDENLIANAYLDKKNKSYDIIYHPSINATFPGAGDIFSSCLLGKVLNGKSFTDAVKESVHFVYKSISYTYSLGTPLREGLCIESLWGDLLEND